MECNPVIRSNLHGLSGWFFHRQIDLKRTEGHCFTDVTGSPEYGPAVWDRTLTAKKCYVLRHLPCTFLQQRDNLIGRFVCKSAMNILSAWRDRHRKDNFICTCKLYQKASLDFYSFELNIVVRVQRALRVSIYIYLFFSPPFFTWL